MAVPIDQNRGYYFDELSKIRVVEPDTANSTQELKENCKEFVDSMFEYLIIYNVDRAEPMCIDHV